MEPDEICEVQRYVDNLIDERALKPGDDTIMTRLLRRYSKGQGGVSVARAELAGDSMSLGRVDVGLDRLERAHLIWREAVYEIVDGRPRRRANRYHLRTKAEALELALDDEPEIVLGRVSLHPSMTPVFEQQPYLLENLESSLLGIESSIEAIDEREYDPLPELNAPEAALEAGGGERLDPPIPALAGRSAPVLVAGGVPGGHGAQAPRDARPDADFGEAMGQDPRNPDRDRGRFAGRGRALRGDAGLTGDLLAARQRAFMVQQARAHERYEQRIGGRGVSG